MSMMACSSGMALFIPLLLLMLRCVRFGAYCNDLRKLWRPVLSVSRQPSMFTSRIEFCIFLRNVPKSVMPCFPRSLPSKISLSSCKFGFFEASNIIFALLSPRRQPVQIIFFSDFDEPMNSEKARAPSCSRSLLEKMSVYIGNSAHALKMALIPMHISDRC